MYEYGDNVFVRLQKPIIIEEMLHCKEETISKVKK